MQLKRYSKLNKRGILIKERMNYKMQFEEIKTYLNNKFGIYRWDAHYPDNNNIKILIVKDMMRYNKTFNLNLSNETIIKEIENYKTWGKSKIPIFLKCLIEILSMYEDDLTGSLYLDLSESGTLLDEDNYCCYDIGKINELYIDPIDSLIKFKYAGKITTIDLSDYFYEVDYDDYDIYDDYMCGKTNCIKDDCHCWNGSKCLL